MRGLIAYDTYYGNGAQVAAAIADELRSAGHDVRLLNLHEEKADTRSLAAETDFLVLGGPTRMKHIGRRAKRFAKHLDAKDWANKPALVYDTYGPLDPDPAKNENNSWLYPGGVADLREILMERKLAVDREDLRCLVVEQKGPLADGALDDARAAARIFAERLQGLVAAP